MSGSMLAHGGGLAAFDEVVILFLFLALGVGMGLVLKAAATDKTSTEHDGGEDAESLEKS